MFSIKHMLKNMFYTASQLFLNLHCIFVCHQVEKIQKALQLDKDLNKENLENILVFRYKVMCSLLVGKKSLREISEQH